MFSPSTVKELMAERQRLQAEKRRIDERLRALDSILEYESSTEQHDSRDDSFEGGPSHGKPIKDEIYDILLSVGSPMHRSVIHDRLVERMVRVGGRNPIHTVGTHLSNDERFTSKGKGVWALAKPSPEQGRRSPRHNESGLVNSPGDAPSQRKTIKDEIYDILLGGNGPMHRSAIYDRLVEIGVRFGGLNPINSMSGHLSADPRFTNTGRGMWTLTEPPSEQEAQPNPRHNRGGFDVAEPDGNGIQNTSVYDEDEEDVPW